LVKKEVESDYEDVKKRMNENMRMLVKKRLSENKRMLVKKEVE
jgi:hypothetical protein